MQQAHAIRLPFFTKRRYKEVMREQRRVDMDATAALEGASDDDAGVDGEAGASDDKKKL